MGNTCGEPLTFSEVGPEVVSALSIFALTIFTAADPWLRRFYRSTLLVVLVLESIRRGGWLLQKWYEREGRCKYELDSLMKLTQTTLDVLFILENAFFTILRLINFAKFWRRDVRTWVQYVLPTALAVCPLVALCQATFSGNPEPILNSIRLHCIFFMQVLSLIGVVMLWRRVPAYRHLLIIFAVLLIIELPAAIEPIYETYFEPSKTLEDIKRWYAQYANSVFALATIGILIRQRVVAYRTRYCWDDAVLL